MFRFIELHLQAWKKHPLRKPILLQGARQVGKTFTIRKFGESFDNFVEANF
jgi:predicted AAA+ superfamily ATPase